MSGSGQGQSNVEQECLFCYWIQASCQICKRLSLLGLLKLEKTRSNQGGWGVAERWHVGVSVVCNQETDASDM